MTDTLKLAALNTALGLCGQEPAAAIDDAALAASGAATKLLRHMDDARDVVLRRHGWVCALSYVELAPAVITGYVNWRYPYPYLLPGDGLHVWEIAGSLVAGRVAAEGFGAWGRWQLGTHENSTGSRIVIRSTTDGKMPVAYVRRAAWGALDVHVRDAVAHEVAARGAYAVTGDRGVAKDLRAQADSRIILAISTDGTQEEGQPELMTSIPRALRNSSR